VQRTTTGIVGLIKGRLRNSSELLKVANWRKEGGKKAQIRVVESRKKILGNSAFLCARYRGGKCAERGEKVYVNVL